MQTTHNAPLYAKLKFPAIAMIFVQALLQIASFNLINTKDWIDPSVYTLPEEDGYSISFKQSGYDSVLLIVNASPAVWMYILHFATMIFVFGPICLINKISGRLAKTKD